jgi:hypothetical protein
MAESTQLLMEKKRAQNRADVARYQRRNPEAVRARKALWFQMNKERRRLLQMQYRQERKAERAMDALRALEGASIR